MGPRKQSRDRFRSFVPFKSGEPDGFRVRPPPALG